MTIKIIVFDFDGTLIDSNRLKYNAFFEVFPDDDRHVGTIREVLADLNEQSRFVILAEILRRLDRPQGSGLQAETARLADRYNDIVLSGAKMCPPMPAAESVLRALSRQYRLYLSSTTPDAELKEIVRFRNWHAHFEGVYGYPHQKPATLRSIMERENANAKQLVVVGDGNSDRQSAKENACFFVQVTEKFDLRNLDGIIAAL